MFTNISIKPTEDSEKSGRFFKLTSTMEGDLNPNAAKHENLKFIIIGAMKCGTSAVGQFIR